MAKTAKKKIAFTPIEDRVLVRPNKAETMSASGIVLPDSAQEAPLRGDVVAVGAGRLSKDGKKRLELPVAIGDVVVYGKYSGNEIEFEGQDYKILRADEILAKIEG
ncbi:MAG: co-chaperone GroES [Planctomycetota bacterium]|nr:co-chaperone GroES [Planctomycetota bacterium]MDA1114482.1 co-chaperone GroES [Planctomycetota bacterium]